MEQLQRYTNQELTEIAKEIFYDYLSDEKDGIPNVKEVFDVYQNRLEKYEAKLQQYIEKISKSDTNEALRQALNMDILYLEETIPHIKNACMKYQKDLYLHHLCTNRVYQVLVSTYLLSYSLLILLMLC